MPKPFPYRPELDGVRAVAVLLVILYHIDGAPWAALNGGRGVTIFFVLSGYLITTLLLREHAATGRIALGQFLGRRAFRLFPAYYLVLGLYCALTFLTPLNDPEKRAALVRVMPHYLFYFQDWPHYAVMGVVPGPLPAGGAIPFGLAWSLGVEEKFYLLWPLLGFVVLRRFPRLRLGAAILLAVLGLLYPLTADYASILVGCVLALVLATPAGDRLVTPCATTAGALVILALTVWCHATQTTGFGAAGYPVLVALTLVTVMHGPRWLTAALAWRPLVWAGTISYGAYLLNQLAMETVHRLVPDWGTVPLTLGTIAFTFFAAWVLAVTVERPVRRWGRNWLAERASERGDAPMRQPVT